MIVTARTDSDSDDPGASCMYYIPVIFRFFFFTDTSTTEIYTLSLHDALPIFALLLVRLQSDVRIEDVVVVADDDVGLLDQLQRQDRKSTRLNSSHRTISYAVFCLKKKKKSSPFHSRPRSATRSRIQCRMSRAT